MPPAIAPDLLAGITGNESGSGGGVGGVFYAVFFIAAAIAVIGYVISLRWHPYRNCHSCGGQGRKRGAIYTYTQRTCAACKGSGRQLRFGNRLRNLSQN